MAGCDPQIYACNPGSLEDPPPTLSSVFSGSSSSSGGSKNGSTLGYSPTLACKLRTPDAKPSSSSATVSAAGHDALLFIMGPL